MNRRYILLTFAIVGGLLSSNCSVGGGGGGGASSDPQPALIYPQPSSAAVNSATMLRVSGANALTNSSWVFSGLAGSVGTLSPTTGDTTTYTAPPTPPVYPNQLNPAVQGRVTIVATISGTGSTSINFPITAASVTTGISSATASIALGSTRQFNGYAVGSTNNGVTFQVNGVTGGSVDTGTITNSIATTFPGLYTAPPTMPIAGSTVTITVVSQSDPTKSSRAVVTLH